VCRIAKIVKDEEIAQLIAQSDSDLPSEMDDSFELSLESDSSVLEQTPKVWCSSSCESDELESDGTSGSEGSGWQEVADGNHIQAQTTFQYNEMHGPKHAPSQDACVRAHTHPPAVLYFRMFLTVQLLNEFVKQINNYARNFLQAHTDLPPNSRTRKWKNVTVAELKIFIACSLNR
jgi:hypothetical protein